MSRIPVSMKEFQRRYTDAVGCLLDRIPRLYSRLAGFPARPIREMPGWESLRQKPRDQLLGEGGPPALVAALIGPTGAGKSTIFRTLTGVQVPSGNRRPTSHGIAVSLPYRVRESGRFETLFPGLKMIPLTGPEDLEKSAPAENQLYWAEGETIGGEESQIDVVLVDTPDFNATERRNWELSDQMLARAEMVIFVTYAEGYKDARVVEQLRRACQSAGSLVFLVNKVPGRSDSEVRSNGHIIWEDLLETVARDDMGFTGVQRSDRRSLDRFLAGSPVYFLPWMENPTRYDVLPSKEGGPSLVEHLTGSDATRILVSGLLESTRVAVGSCRQLLVRAEKQRLYLENCIHRVEREVEQESVKMAVSQFPIGKLLEKLIEESRKERTGFLKYGLMPSVFLGKVARGAIREIREMVSSKDKKGLADGQELERSRREEAAQRLIDQWRKDFPGEVREGGFLSQPECERALHRLEQRPIPPINVEWEEFVEGKARVWIKENPKLSLALAAVGDLLISAGVTAVALDLVAFGGAFSFMGTQLGVAAVAGTSAAGVGYMMDLMSRLHLQDVLQAADKEWRTLRAKDYSQHLVAELATPLLISHWKADLLELREGFLNLCGQACDTLEDLIYRYGRGI